MTPASPGEPASRAEVCAVGPDLWFRRGLGGTYVIGLTRAAQRRAGTIAHYRGPEVGRRYRRDESAVTLESDKWVGHLTLPVAGTVVETNETLAADPGAINREPYGAGWLYRMRPEDATQLEALAREAPGDPQ